VLKSFDDGETAKLSADFPELHLSLTFLFPDPSEFYDFFQVF